MVADLTHLVPEFQQAVQALVVSCAKRGIEMRPSTGLRDPFEQARLWRQSRAIEEINRKIAELQAAGAVFLAHCIASAGPQNGRYVTDALPGFSWHQWGEALDCFWVVNKKAEWSTDKLIDGLNGYRVYAEEAGGVGLTAGGTWKTLKDWPHVQLRAASSPRSALSVLEIDHAMEAMFGG